MPNIKSQIKRLRKSEEQRLRNKSVKSRIKTNISRLKRSLEDKNKEEAQKHLLTAVRSLDKAASKGVIHRNQASNKKSKLMKKLKTLA